MGCINKLYNVLFHDAMKVFSLKPHSIIVMHVDNDYVQSDTLFVATS